MTGRYSDTGLLEFTKRLIALRRTHPVFRRGRFLAGTEASELRWFTPAGTEMTAADWAESRRSWPSRCTWMDATTPTRPPTAPGLPTTTSWSWSTPGGSRSISSCPLPGPRRKWQAEIDTYDPAAPRRAAARRAGDHVTVGPRSVAVLRAASPR